MHELVAWSDTFQYQRCIELTSVEWHNQRPLLELSLYPMRSESERKTKESINYSTLEIRVSHSPPFVSILRNPSRRLKVPSTCHSTTLPQQESTFERHLEDEF